MWALLARVRACSQHINLVVIVSFEIQSAVLLWLHYMFDWDIERISQYTDKQSYLYALSLVMFGLCRGPNKDLVSEDQRWREVGGVTSMHPEVIDVKRSIKSYFRANPSLPCIALPATQPAQYLLRHLQSNLGWQAQMASLIQVNYLSTFQSKQTCHSPQVWTIGMKSLVIVCAHVCARVRLS